MVPVCSDMATLLETAGGRVRQFRDASMPLADAMATDAALRQVVENDQQWQLLARLTPFDRLHHLRVYNLLVEQGETDADLLLAAALHDSGKADDRMRVALPHRVVWVLLGATSPGALVRLASRDNWIGHGLFLAMRHPELGALLAQQAGASERCCELVRRHHEPFDSVADPLLRALILADEEAGR